MRVKRINGLNEVKLDKGETRRLLEASYILDAIAGVTGGVTQEEASNNARHLRNRARQFGGEHLEGDGTLKEPERRKAIDASAPT